MLFAEILFGSTKAELRVDILLIRTQVPISCIAIFWIKDTSPNNTFLGAKLCVLERSTAYTALYVSDVVYFVLSYILSCIVTSKEDTITQYRIAGNFQENFCEFCGFVAICESFFHEVWGHGVLWCGTSKQSAKVSL